jgi:glutamyl/glutaminyl-tRNA synthetase
MQINLRKAAAIQSEIRKAISNVKTEQNVTVNEFTADVEAVMSKGELEFRQALERKEALNKALFQIRSAVGRANVESGINDVLADIQLIDAQIAIKNTVASATVRKDIGEINARIVKMKQASGSERGALYSIDRYNSVESSVVSEVAINAAKAEVKMLKRERQGLNDKLLQLNVNTLIQLSDPTKLTLQEEGLV